MMKALEATGTRDYRGQQVRTGEVIAYRNLFWSLSEAMARNATPWVNGAVLPDIVAGTAFWTFGSTFYPIVKNLIEQSVASGLIYLNSSASDFQNPELRPYLDKYIRGTAGYDSVERVKLMKLLWDAIGTEFGGRGELYEINWAGSTEETRISTLGIAQAIGPGGPDEGVRRLLPRRVRPQRLDRPGPHQPRRRELAPEALTLAARGRAARSSGICRASRRAYSQRLSSALIHCVAASLSFRRRRNLTLTCSGDRIPPRRDDKGRPGATFTGTVERRSPR